MKIFYGYNNVKGLMDPVAAIGNFDGLHVGHKKVLSKLMSDSARSSDKVVITFDPHPKTVVDPGSRHMRIMSLEHKLFIMRKMGIDAVIVIKFTEVFSKINPEDFIRKVLCKMGCRKVYIGANFKFGRGKKGDADYFMKTGAPYGVEVHKVTPVKRANKVISSTWVRKLVAKGEIRKAEAILRRPVSILGTVIKGDQRGREIGFPTANIYPYHEVIPPPGVYAVKVDLGGNLYDGVLNIGFNPTFLGKGMKRKREPRIEVNIASFKGHLYGVDVEIFFIKKMRNEKKFRSEKGLVSQIQRDKDMAEKFLKSPRITRKIKKYKYI